jgi:hypothetical protein
LLSNAPLTGSDGGDPSGRNRAKKVPAQILSNCTWEDGEVATTFRQPFDLLAKTTAIAARHEAGNRANPAKSEIWLGDLDSNQDWRSQSPA